MPIPTPLIIPTPHEWQAQTTEEVLADLHRGIQATKGSNFMLHSEVENAPGFRILSQPHSILVQDAT